MVEWWSGGVVEWWSGKDLVSIYRVTPRTRVETKFKMVLGRRAACSTCLLCSLHLLPLHCSTLFALHCSPGHACCNCHTEARGVKWCGVWWVVW